MCKIPSYTLVLFKFWTEERKVPAILLGVNKNDEVEIKVLHVSTERWQVHQHQMSEKSEMIAVRI